MKQNQEKGIENCNIQIDGRTLVAAQSDHDRGEEAHYYEDYGCQ